MIFYLGREKRERAEKMSSLVKYIVGFLNHLVLRLIPVQCVKRGEWESG
jgi:heme/copper-type cytochrome/quinol oxidase subunit 4